MVKRSIFVWALYDFANSFVFITFLLYFSKWLVVENDLSDWWYNATYIFGSVALIFAAPFFGRRADVRHRGRFYLTTSTLLCFASYALAIAAAILKVGLFWPALFFGTGNFFYQLSFVFYNPILGKISNPTNRGRVSGLGYLANYTGQILAIAIALPLVSGKVGLFGIDPLIAPLLVASFVFLILSIPLLLRRELFSVSVNKPGVMAPRVATKEIIMIPGLVLFLTSFFLFSDAITTLVNNFSIFMSSLFDVSNSQISIMILIIITCAAIGAWFFGWLSDRISSRKTLLFILLVWVVTVPAIALAEVYAVFFLLSAVAGLCVGGSWAVARQFLVETAPAPILNYVFGFFAISERAATIIGPLAWSLVLSFGGYRWAMFSLTIFLLAAVLLVLKIPERQIQLKG